MVNRWITQSAVFQCTLAGIVQWYLCVCVRKRQRWGHGREGIHLSPKYYTVVKNICNARGYFEKYLKKFNSALTFCWAFVNRFTLHIIWLRVREDVTVSCCWFQNMLIYSLLVLWFLLFLNLLFYSNLMLLFRVLYANFNFQFEIICLIHKSNFKK